MFESKNLAQVSFKSLDEITAFLESNEISRSDVVNIQYLGENDYLLIYWK